jgi:hypothetical protein
MIEPAEYTLDVGVGSEPSVVYLSTAPAGVELPSTMVGAVV